MPLKNWADPSNPAYDADRVSKARHSDEESYVQYDYSKRKPMITVTPDDMDGFTFEIAYTDPTGQRIAAEVVNLGPSPTWPSPTEQSDMLADAVRRVNDAAWTYYSGEVIER